MYGVSQYLYIQNKQNEVFCAKISAFSFLTIPLMYQNVLVSGNLLCHKYIFYKIKY